MTKNIRIVYEGRDQTFFLVGEFECRENCLSCILKFNCLTNDAIYTKNSYIDISIINNFKDDMPYAITWFTDKRRITIDSEGNKILT